MTRLADPFSDLRTTRARGDRVGFGVAGALVWAVLIALGGKNLIDYAAQPGSAMEPPRAWPAASRLTPPNERPVLLMFLHPRCPCSRASVANLARVMTRGHERLDARALFIAPEETPAEEDRTALFREAALIPGVEVLFDLGGREAREFHAATSGHAFVYDRRGQLVFSGGLTPARGHEGDSAGCDALRAFLETGAAAPASFPVFGCALFTTEESRQDAADAQAIGANCSACGARENP